MSAFDRKTRLPVLIALIGAAALIASASLDLWRDGAPGIGATQILGMGLGLATILLAHGLSGREQDGLGPRDVPWILGVLAIGTASVAILISPRPIEPQNPFSSYAVGHRLLALEQASHAPRRSLARCYPGSHDDPVPVAVEPLVTGLRTPVYVTPAGDGSRRLFIVEKGGSIRIAEGERLRDDPFLDIRERIYSPENPSAKPSHPEQGLLSVAFPPDFETSGHFYVYYTGFPDGLIHLSRFQLSDDPNRADPASEQIIFTVSTVGPTHNAGQLHFGPYDDYLYVAVGDGGGWRWPTGDTAVYGDGAVELADDDGVIIPPGSGFAEDDFQSADPWNQAQDLGTLRGKILRLDVSGDSTYAIPPDNPFADDGDETTRGEIWAYGLRNPWRFSFDGCDGALFAADVGNARYEEINLIEPGRNYGWKRMEAGHCHPEWWSATCDTRGLTYPISEYSHLSLDATGGNAVIGGYVYRGRRLPSLVGRYVFGDWMSARVWSLTPTPRSASGWRMELLTTLGFLPTSFGLDAEGELLITGYGGTVYRIVPGHAGAD